MGNAIEKLKWTQNTLEGIVVPYNKKSLPWKMPTGKMVYERFSPGAFSQSIADINSKRRTIYANINHGYDNALLQIGSSASNIELEETEEGVRMRMRLLDETVSNDIWQKVAAGLVNGLSVEFAPLGGQEPRYAIENGDYIRIWDRAIINGFAIVKDPRYADAKCWARSQKEISELPVGLVSPIVKNDTLRLRILEGWLYGIR